EIADLLESLPNERRAEVWTRIPSERQGEVLSHAQDAVRASLLEHMDPAQLAAVTEALETDDAADLLQDLSETLAERVLRSMHEQNRARVASVLSYPEDTAGGLMNVDTITVRSDVHLDAVVRYLRWRADLPEKTDSLMVVDRDNRYQGVLPLTILLTHGPERTVGELTQALEPIPAHLPASEVAKRFEQHDLLSAPVVDNQGRLVGRITIDDVVDVIRVQGDHSFMSLAGLNEEDDMFAPITVSAPRRALWLGVNLVTALLAAWVIGHFEATIEKIVALAILMPVVASMGGIAGSQTLTIVIRGLALGQVGRDNSRALLRKEIAVGLCNGLIWASVVGLVAANWFKDAGLGAVIALALITNLLAGALAGTLIPLTLKRLGIDPALAGGLFLTTVTDVVGFTAFLGLATLFLI
ncbi:MAG: magnesium transporter, partial [Beggiatoa sp.]|nr:magnesium transporter [Beggiatoa sp.]